MPGGEISQAPPRRRAVNHNIDRVLCERAPRWELGSTDDRLDVANSQSLTG